MWSLVPVLRFLGSSPEDKVGLDSLRSEDVFGLVGLRLRPGARAGRKVIRSGARPVSVVR